MARDCRLDERVLFEGDEVPAVRVNGEEGDDGPDDCRQDGNASLGNEDRLAFGLSLIVGGNAVRLLSEDRATSKEAALLSPSLLLESISSPTPSPSESAPMSISPGSPAALGLDEASPARVLPREDRYGHGIAV